MCGAPSLNLPRLLSLPRSHPAERRTTSANGRCRAFERLQDRAGALSSTLREGLSICIRLMNAAILPASRSVDKRGDAIMPLHANHFEQIAFTPTDILLEALPRQ